MKHVFTFLVWAWVLWQELFSTDPNPPKPSWRYLEAYKNRATCEGAIGPFIEKAAGNASVVQKVIWRYDNGLRFINQDGYEMRLIYICTPDNVDPRPR